MLQQQFKDRFRDNINVNQCFLSKYVLVNTPPNKRWATAHALNNIFKLEYDSVKN